MAEQLGWLVPGLLQERVVALIRTLAKPIRRRFEPPSTEAHCHDANSPYWRSGYNLALGLEDE